MLLLLLVVVVVVALLHIVPLRRWTMRMTFRTKCRFEAFYETSDMAKPHRRGLF
jgi:hypothetical protein